MSRSPWLTRSRRIRLLRLALLLGAAGDVALGATLVVPLAGRSPALETAALPFRAALAMPWLALAWGGLLAAYDTRRFAPVAGLVAAVHAAAGALLALGAAAAGGARALPGPLLAVLGVAQAVLWWGTRE